MRSCAVGVLTAAVASILPGQAAVEAAPPTLLLEWGSFGTGEGQFDGPWGIVFDPGASRVLVADTGNHRVQVFTEDGVFVTQWGTQGSGPGQFQQPMDVAVSASDVVYVADVANNRIQAFTREGAYLFEWGATGTGEGQFDRPFAVAIGPSQRVFVADYGNSRIQIFQSDGTFVEAWDGGYDPLYDLDVDESGKVYSAGLNGVTVRDADGSFVDYWEVVGGKGMTSVALGGDGLGYVMDGDRVHAFTRDGTLVTEWITRYARYIAVQADNIVYVASDSDHVIQKYGSLPVSVEGRSWGRVKAGYGD